jgi:ATP-binding cassette subfamily B protein
LSHAIPPPVPPPDSPLRRLLALAWRYRGLSLVVFAAQVGLLALALAGLGLSGLGIDLVRRALDAAAPAPHFPLGLAPPAGWGPGRVLVVLGAGVLAVAAVRAALSYGHALAAGRLVHLDIVPELRTRVFDKLQRLSFRFFDRNASGAIINRVTGDVQSVRSFVDGVLLAGAVMVLSLLVCLGYMLRTHVGLTLACLGPTPLILVATGLFSRFAGPAYRKNRELYDDMVLAMSEGVRGVTVTKVFGREDHDLARFAGKNRAVLDQQQQLFRRVSRFGPSIQIIAAVDMAILLLYGGSLVAREAMTLGDLVVFAGLWQQFSGQVANMAGIFNTLEQSLAAARRVFEVLDAPLEVESPPRPVPLPRVSGALAFEGVEFGYAEGQPVLRGVDFRVEAGRCVGIFGVAGAGKSTLLSLVPRFFDVGRGAVRVDGVDVRELDLDGLRRNIGLVFQESVLFRQTVAENIAFGHPDAGRDAIERAARIAGAHDFICELPQGYDTVIEEGAVNLSGGQRQRIAIARALLPAPPILLLDDPTSAIDPHLEHEVLAALAEATRGRTTLLVSSRLSALRHAAEVLVIDGGRVAERGTHAELMARRGIYFRAASLQVTDDDEEAA